MGEWSIRFWTEHGDRLIFMFIAALIAVAFMLSGLGELAEAGKVILIGIAMLCYNKARSTTDKGVNDEKSDS